MSQQNQQPATKWSFERLADAFERVFADLTDEIINGEAPALPNEQMEAINLTWSETLASARWTFKQWNQAVA